MSTWRPGGCRVVEASVVAFVADRVPNRRASVAVWGGVASLDRRGSARRRNRSTGQTQPFCCSFTASRRLITDVVFVNTFEKGTIHTRDSRSFEPAAAPSGRHPCGVRSDPLPTDRAGAARPSMSSPVPYSPETPTSFTCHTDGQHHQASSHRPFSAARMDAPAASEPSSLLNNNLLTELPFIT